jgi:hypothetical protein
MPRRFPPSPSLPGCLQGRAQGDHSVVQRERTTAERVAVNEHTFREANDRIEKAADEIGSGLETVPFICECADRDCVEIVRLARSDYQAVRADPRTFLVAPGHETTQVEGVEVAQTQVKLEHFSLMEKIGETGEIAEELADVPDGP